VATVALSDSSPDYSHAHTFYAKQAIEKNMLNSTVFKLHFLTTNTKPNYMNKTRSIKIDALYNFQYIY